MLLQSIEPGTQSRRRRAGKAKDLFFQNRFGKRSAFGQTPNMHHAPAHDTPPPITQYAVEVIQRSILDKGKKRRGGGIGESIRKAKTVAGKVKAGWPPTDHELRIVNPGFWRTHAIGIVSIFMRQYACLSLTRYQCSKLI